MVSFILFTHLSGDEDPQFREGFRILEDIYETGQFFTPKLSSSSFPGARVEWFFTHYGLSHLRHIACVSCVALHFCRPVPARSGTNTLRGPCQSLRQALWTVYSPEKASIHAQDATSCFPGHTSDGAPVTFCQGETTQFHLAGPVPSYTLEIEAGSMTYIDDGSSLCQIAESMHEQPTVTCDHLYPDVCFPCFPSWITCLMAGAGTVRMMNVPNLS